MNTLVCLKQVLDPDLPARDFKIDPEAKEAERGSANLVTNIFCENALETALQLREKLGGKVTALCYGGEEAEDSLRKALAMTVDEAALVSREGNSNPDPASVATVLAAAIRKLGSFDLIMVGRESADWGVGQTGGLLAEELNLPMLAFVDDLEGGEGGGLRIKRQTDFGLEIAEAPTPLLVTITNSDHNVPRIPKTKDVMMSYRKPLTKMTLEELGVDSDEIKDGNSYYEVVDIFAPTTDVECEFVEGDSIEEKVEAFSQHIATVLAAM